MKGGIGCSILAARLLAEMAHAWAGEVVVTLCGDEESMGTKGTAWLLDTFPTPDRRRYSASARRG